MPGLNCRFLLPPQRADLAEAIEREVLLLPQQHARKVAVFDEQRAEKEQLLQEVRKMLPGPELRVINHFSIPAGPGGVRSGTGRLSEGHG